MIVQKSRSDRFKEAARELGCDEDKGRWDERLRKLTKREAAAEKAG